MEYQYSGTWHDKHKNLLSKWTDESTGLQVFLRQSRISGQLDFEISDKKITLDQFHRPPARGHDTKHEWSHFNIINQM